jgi:hypothetical protein
VSRGRYFRRITNPAGKRCSINLYTAFTGTPVTAPISAGENSSGWDMKKINLSLREYLRLDQPVFKRQPSFAVQPQDFDAAN